MARDNLEMSMLLDFYGEALTEKQRYMFDCYYNEDLSLSEIAENEGISRQGARDIIVRAEGVMKNLEERTGSISRYMAYRPAIETVLAASAEIERLAKGSVNSREILQNVESIRKAIGNIKDR